MMIKRLLLSSVYMVSLNLMLDPKSSFGADGKSLREAARSGVFGKVLKLVNDLSLKGNLKLIFEKNLKGNSAFFLSCECRDTQSVQLYLSLASPSQTDLDHGLAIVISLNLSEPDSRDQVLMETLLSKGARADHWSNDFSVRQRKISPEARRILFGRSNGFQSDSRFDSPTHLSPLRQALLDGDDVFSRPEPESSFEFRQVQNEDDASQKPARSTSEERIAIQTEKLSQESLGSLDEKESLDYVPWNSRRPFPPSSSRKLQVIAEESEADCEDTSEVSHADETPSLPRSLLFSR